MPVSTRTPSPSSVPEFGCRVGHFEVVHRAGLRLPALGGVLGVQPGLDRVAARRRWLGVEAAAVGDLQLQRDEVEAGGRLGDRVLDLQTGVHLEEEEVALLVGQELDGARAGVPDGGRPRAAPRRTACPACRECVSTRGDGASSTIFWWRRWIEHSRSPTAHTVPCSSASTCTSTWWPVAR